MLRDITGKLNRYLQAFKKIGFEEILQDMDRRISANGGFIVFTAGIHNTTGGSGTTEVISVPGALETDVVFANVLDDPTASYTPVIHVVADEIRLTFQSDPADFGPVRISYQLLRQV